MKIRTGVVLLVVVLSVVLYGTIMAVMITGWQNSNDYIWSYASQQTNDNIIDVLRESIASVKFAARSVSNIEPLLESESLPSSNYDPEMLQLIFTSS